jgi:hypothetical protein
MERGIPLSRARSSGVPVHTSLPVSIGMASNAKVGRVKGYQEICLFENQRYRPLFGWGSKGFLFPHDRSPFSDETGRVAYAVHLLEDVPPPPNCEWVTAWKISHDYTEVDAEGWSYSSSFSRLSEKLTKKTSSSTPRPGHVVRRRMWSRYARRLRASLSPSEDIFEQVQSQRFDQLTPRRLPPPATLITQLCFPSTSPKAHLEEVTARLMQLQRPLLLILLLPCSTRTSDWEPASTQTRWLAQTGACFT